MGRGGGDPGGLCVGGSGVPGDGWVGGGGGPGSGWVGTVMSNASYSGGSRISTRWGTNSPRGGATYDFAKFP